jgi:hypothetical protein
MLTDCKGMLAVFSGANASRGMQERYSRVKVQDDSAGMAAFKTAADVIL